MRVKDVMTTRVISVAPDTDVREVARILPPRREPDDRRRRRGLSANRWTIARGKSHAVVHPYHQYH